MPNNNILKNTLSVAIITFNEEDKLGKTLQSVNDLADEIIIIDSGSEDSTLKIAEDFKAKVYKEVWKGFGKQKNSLVGKCSCNWILFLDADEPVSFELKKFIKSKILNSDPVEAGFMIQRKTHYLGKLLEHSWQPDFKLRLVRNTENICWNDDMIHEVLNIKGKISKAKGHLIHYSYRNISNHFEKSLVYSKLTAEKYFKNGKHFSMINIIINPIFAFIKIYFLNFGIVDGFRGFLAAFSSFYSTLMKYAFLYELEKKDKTDE
jgi:glycosyltransferase involved in cell wall biosynthesis